MKGCVREVRPHLDDNATKLWLDDATAALAAIIVIPSSNRAHVQQLVIPREGGVSSTPLPHLSQASPGFRGTRPGRNFGRVEYISSASRKRNSRIPKRAYSPRADNATVRLHSTDRTRMHGVMGKPPGAATDTASATSRTTLLLLVAMTGVAPISLYMLVPALPVLGHHVRARYFDRADDGVALHGRHRLLADHHGPAVGQVRPPPGAAGGPRPDGGGERRPASSPKRCRN